MNDEVVLELIRTFKPLVIGGGSLLFFYILIRITDRSIGSTIRETIGEFGHLIKGKRGLRALNAMGGILLFVATIFLYFSGLSHLVLPDLGQASHPNTAAQTIYAVVIYGFIIYFLLSLMVCRFEA